MVPEGSMLERGGREFDHPIGVAVTRSQDRTTYSSQNPTRTALWLGKNQGWQQWKAGGVTVFLGFNASQKERKSVQIWGWGPEKPDQTLILNPSAWLLTPIIQGLQSHDTPVFHHPESWLASICIACPPQPMWRADFGLSWRCCWSDTNSHSCRVRAPWRCAACLIFLFKN